MKVSLTDFMGLFDKPPAPTTVKPAAETVKREVEKRIGLLVEDTRAQADPSQVTELRKRIERDGVEKILGTLQEVLPLYCRAEKQIRIEIGDRSAISARAHAGEALPGLARVTLPSEEEGIKETLEMIKNIRPDATREQARDLFYDLKASVTLHESTHAILETRPGTPFHGIVERLAGKEDPGAGLSTLCDEGLAYGIQGLFARNSELVGSLSPRIRTEEDVYSRRGKRIGQTLRPVLQKLFDEKKPPDEQFMKQLVATALQVIEEIPDLPSKKE